MPILGNASNFNLFYNRTTKGLLCLDGGKIAMKLQEEKQSKIKTVRDEPRFFSLIEEHMAQKTALGDELIGRMEELLQRVSH